MGCKQTVNADKNCNFSALAPVHVASAALALIVFQSVRPANAVKRMSMQKKCGSSCLAQFT
jgi:hypothetical protein